MAISLKYKYHQTERHPLELAEEKKKIITPLTNKFTRLGILFSIFLVIYIIVFSKVILADSEKYLFDRLFKKINQLTERETPENVLPTPVEKIYDSLLTARLSGFILLAVEQKGEAWYVSPKEKKRYFLGRTEEAAGILRHFGTGVAHGFLSRRIYPDDFLGKIMIDDGQAGEAYYVYPADKKAYPINRPEDISRLIRDFGKGISNADLDKIEIGTIDSE